MPAAAAEPAVPVADASPAPAEPGSDNTLAIAGLIGLVALGGAGILVATRRRRPLAEDMSEDEVVYASEPAEQERAEFVPAAAPVVTPTYRAEPGAFATMAAPTPRQTQVVATAPAEIPEPQAAPLELAPAAAIDPDDRHAILESMVDAEPNEENPFTSRKARMRRARLILQGRESRGEPLTGKAQPIDWTQYKPFRSNELIDA